MLMENDRKFVILVVMDGWGIAPDGPANAISQAKVVNFRRYWASFPHTQLKAAGNAVGLPKDEAGNTETGHLNLGAGRIVFQDLERINMAIADGSFFQNQVIKGAINHAVKFNSNLHIMGLVGSGGVHSNIEHLFALLNFVKQANFKRVYLHLFTDGRDSPPTSSLTYIKSIQDILKRDGVGQIATVMGRYWAMDRDRRWDRTEKAYIALTQGKGSLVKTVEEAVKNSYSEGKTDEFIEPSVITTQDGTPVGVIKENDSCIFFNFRIDRPRQLTSAFVVDNFSDASVNLDFDPYLERYKMTHLASKATSYQKVFKREPKIKNLYFATMTEYSKTLLECGTKVIISADRVDMPIGRVISENGLRQLRVSESEKERFVTYYFNGMRETPFPGEEKLIIPSPNVLTYDLKPEMSALEMTDKLLENLKQNPEYSFVLLNFANVDMVGHTGSIGPAVKACETVDMCIGKLANYILAYGGYLLLTADHGNAEEMINPHTGAISTEHSVNNVPLIIISQKYMGKMTMLTSGILADVAPTVLGLLGVTPPSDMTGRNLLDESMRI